MATAFVNFSFLNIVEEKFCLPGSQLSKLKRLISFHIHAKFNRIITNTNF